MDLGVPRVKGKIEPLGSGTCLMGVSRSLPAMK